MANDILLVEDNPTDEKLTLRAFKKTSIPSEIAVARDGVEALEYLFATGRYALRESSRLPSIVLLDLKLPLIDGLEVLRRIREHERTKVLPVIVLTASKEEEDIERSYALGVNAYVRKPLDFPDFIEAARTISLFWLRFNESPQQRRGAS